MNDFDFFGIPVGEDFITFCLRLKRAGWLVSDIPPTNQNGTILIGLSNYEWSDENIPLGVDLNQTTGKVYQVVAYFVDDYGMQHFNNLFNYVTERYGEFTTKVPNSNALAWQFDNGNILLFQNNDSMTSITFTNHLNDSED